MTSEGLALQRLLRELPPLGLRWGEQRSALVAARPAVPGFGCRLGLRYAAGLRPRESAAGALSPGVPALANKAVSSGGWSGASRATARRRDFGGWGHPGTGRLPAESHAVRSVSGASRAAEPAATRVLRAQPAGDRREVGGGARKTRKPDAVASQYRVASEFRSDVAACTGFFFGRRRRASGGRPARVSETFDAGMRAFSVASGSVSVSVCVGFPSRLSIVRASLDVNLGELRNERRQPRTSRVDSGAWQLSILWIK